MLSDFIVTGTLSSRELRALVKDSAKYSKKSFEAGIQSSSDIRLDNSKRKTQVFFPSIYQFPNTFNLIQSTILEHYSFSGLILSSIAEIQYARYEEGDFFKPHRDVINSTRESLRTLTFSLNISSPQDYSGGELLIYDERKNVIANLEKSEGSFIIFPSILIHEATEVTQGTREAIVAWIHTSKLEHRNFNKQVYK